MLAEHPLCADPFGAHAAEHRIEPATQVDHVVPLSAGGTHRPDNLQCLCVACHSRKTASEDGGFGNQPCGSRCESYSAF